MILPLVVILGTAAAVSVGIYLTLRAFRASEAPAGAQPSATHAGSNNHNHVSRHDQATNEVLKHFFEGKACAVCKRPIPPVQRTGLKPGLLNPQTHETHAWDQIPNGTSAASLEGELPVCPSCAVAESFRQRFPDLVVDRQRSLQQDAVH